MVRDNQIVVTGASGFVARNLRKHLSEKNIRLISISRNDFAEFDCELKIVSKNYDEKSILSKIQNSDALVHLVGIGRQSIKTNYDTVNVEFTKHIINLAKKAKINKFVLTSGLGVSSNSSLGYFISKYKAERLVVNSGLDYTIFRPSYIVGKDDLFTKYLKRQVKKGKIEIPGSGTYSIQPIYIIDAVKIILQSVLQTKFRNKIIDLVGPDYITFKRYVELFSKGTKTSIKKIDLQDVYHDAITNPKSDFGVDDLNILIGSFKGDYNKLEKITKMKLQSVMELLESGRLP